MNKSNRLYLTSWKRWVVVQNRLQKMPWLWLSQQQQQQQQGPTIMEDTENYDDDDDDDEEVQNKKPPSILKKRKRIDEEKKDETSSIEEGDKKPPANNEKKVRYDIDDDNEEEEEDDDGLPDVEIGDNDDIISQIPMGKQAAKMMIAFGDGPNPNPEALSLALLGTRRVLQIAIMDARKVRRRLQQHFQDAQNSLNAYSSKTLRKRGKTRRVTTAW